VFAELLDQQHVVVDSPPHVQLDGLVALGQAAVGQAQVVVERLHRDGAGVGLGPVLVAAEELVGRHARRLGRNVPQRHVHIPQGVHRELFDAVAFPDLVPELLPHERIGAEEHGSETPLDQLAREALVREPHESLDPRVGLYAQQGLPPLAAGTPDQSIPPAKRQRLGLVGLQFKAGDSHVRFSLTRR